MAHAQGPRDPKNSTQGGKQHLEKLLRDVESRVKPLPQIDVCTEVSWKRETPKGKAVKLLSYTSGGLLTCLALFGMITHDREMLFSVLNVVKYSMFALLAWALGKVVTSLLPRSIKPDGDDEEDKDTG